MNAQERLRGCLVGLAIGDALGTSIEFSLPGTFAPITDMLGGGPFHLLPGQWTDDTSMALCLAESLVECQGFDPIDQLKRYTLWSQEGHLSSNGRCFDIGGTVRQALRRFRQTGEPICGSTDPSTAGNGSLMRLAPVPMFFADQPVQAIEVCTKLADYPCCAGCNRCVQVYGGAHLRRPGWRSERSPALSALRACFRLLGAGSPG